MKTTLAILVLATLLGAPVASAICISDLAFELDECSIRRGAREPAAHCSSSGMGRAASQPRTVAEVKPAAAPAVAVATWGSVKAEFASR